MNTSSNLRRLQYGVWLCAATFLAAVGQVSAADDAQAPDVRRAIARSVPFIERGEADWIASKGCMSCHHTAFTVWSLSAAKRKGIPVDEVKLNEWRNWVADWPNLLDPSVRLDPIDQRRRRLGNRHACLDQSPRQAQLTTIRDGNRLSGHR